MLDFTIDTFLTVCEYMNFTKAAQIMCITQPAVSQYIKYLEKTYDTKLFKNHDFYFIWRKNSAFENLYRELVDEF